jgi:hypothetical protein
MNQLLPNEPLHNEARRNENLFAPRCWLGRNENWPRCSASSGVVRTGSRADVDVSKSQRREPRRRKLAISHPKLKEVLHQCSTT